MRAPSCSGRRCGQRRVRAATVGSAGAFTIIELLVVMSIIIVLAGLVIGTSGYVQNKGARSRAEAEIAAMSAALESYKADNGIYPRGKSTATPQQGQPNYTAAATGTDDLNPESGASAKQYQDASRYLYEELSGDSDLDLMTDPGRKSYFAFKESMLARVRNAAGTVIGLSHINDPFGNSYGYSTMRAGDPANAPGGFNPTFDLWSTGPPASDGTQTTDPIQFIKNW